MEHKLILGGEQYLPFARSRIKALRATGLLYASQQFEVDGVSIKVRIAGEHDYISLDAKREGQYLILPADLANPNGGSQSGGAAEAIMNVKDATLKIRKHASEKAGTVDWKNWKTGEELEILTYDHGMTTRYRVGLQTISDAVPRIWVGGKSISTGGRKVMGACIATFVIGGKTVKRKVFITRVGNQVTAYAAPVGLSSVWTAIGVSAAGVESYVEYRGFTYPTEFLDPFFFDGSGTKGISLMSPSGSVLGKRIVRCSLSASESDGVVTVACAFTVGEQVGGVTEITSNLVTPAPGGEWVPAGQITVGEPGYTFSAGYEVNRVTYSNWASSNIRSGQSEERLIGADYSSTGEELLVTAFTSMVSRTLDMHSLDTTSTGSMRISPDWIGFSDDTYKNNYLFYLAQGYIISNTLADRFHRETSSRTFGSEGSIAIRINGVPIYEASHEVMVGYANKGYNDGVATTPTYFNSGPGVSKRLVIHDIDARNRSMVFEEVEQTLTEDRSYPVDVTNPSALRKVSIKLGSKLVARIDNTDVAALDCVDVPNVTRYLGWNGIADYMVSSVAVNTSSGGEVWIGWPYNRLVTPRDASAKAGNTASRELLQFVTSVNGGISHLSYELGQRLATHTKQSLTFSRVAIDGLVLDAAQMAKIPFYSAVPASQFRFNPVKVI